MSTADHPETDGQTERVNRVIEDILRSIATTYPKKWSSMLPLVEFAINSAVHSSTGFTPFYMNNMRHPKLPIALGGVSNPLSKGENHGDIISDDCNEVDDYQLNSTATHSQEYLTMRRSIIRRVRDMIAKAQDMQKQNADKNGRKNFIHFKVGDKVLLSTKTLPKHAISNLGSNKLRPRFIGPFLITKK